MSEVRILAKNTPRGTGIPRTSTQVPRDMSASAASHVSSSPAAGARGQAQVIAARRSVNTRQEAKVTFIDRRAPAGASPASGAPMMPASQRPIVQIVDRNTPAAAPALFSLEQLMLMANLLDQYRENTMAISDTENAAIADGALNVLAMLMQSTGAVPAASLAPLASSALGNPSSPLATEPSPPPVTEPSPPAVGEAVPQVT
jgi:hypothetical protein